jgi:Antitoxin VbhA
MATPATTMPQYDEQELQERRYAVESTLGTTLAEGESPSPEVLELFEKYARGEMSLPEVSSAVRSRYGL